ncbi:YD repeat-containing protein [Streptomyces sp. KhCrAH-43]|uniref:hypothetical protein n=1 Tax=unclassified Streptomyces TaxID=2593676 RepID=UPI00036D3DA9|nr:MULTISPECIES: hypothetical protein [unclassified Streptomyces]MYS37847.1 hypothetical protein [Streptomyces sp. SID4920]MYX66035.1 hypothetical protein [Streptomyces sp. SID8373]RAJ67516.1 YD repeat-containing protein [Streptomyces sp. KhCrAH-43]
MYREFLTPDDEEVYEATGQWPDADEGGARVLTLHDDAGQSVVFSYDAVGRSVRIRWVNDQGVDMLDVFREGATRLSFSSGNSAKGISVDFHTGECAGTLEIQVTPRISVSDRLLFQ